MRAILVEMTMSSRKCLTHVHTGFQTATWSWPVCSAIGCRSGYRLPLCFKRHLETTSPRVGPDSTSILLMAQALSGPATIPRTLPKNCFTWFVGIVSCTLRSSGSGSNSGTETAHHPRVVAQALVPFKRSKFRFCWLLERRDAGL